MDSRNFLPMHGPRQPPQAASLVVQPLVQHFSFPHLSSPTLFSHGEKGETLPLCPSVLGENFFITYTFFKSQCGVVGAVAAMTRGLDV